MAKKKKYHFNVEKMDYEEITISMTRRLLKVFYHLMSGLLLGLLFFLIFASIIKSPQERVLQAEKNSMEGQYKALQGQIREMQSILNTLQERDNNLYRVVFQADPIPLTSRHTSSSNVDYYERLQNMTNSEIVLETTRKINELKKQIYVQSKSYDEIINLAKNREKRLESIPAIQPIANKNLNSIASGFGYRYDPIYHTQRFHKGMDFSAPIGTEIYATGNGKVLSAGWKQGYGKCVEIDHGFGYVTLYAHMFEIKCYVGSRVVRGEIIGLVGNTGKSTGPHLHYEVHLNGNIMNPQNYYYLDLTPEEYDRMIEKSENSGQMLD